MQTKNNTMLKREFKEVNGHIICNFPKIVSHVWYQVWEGKVSRNQFNFWIDHI